MDVDKIIAENEGDWNAFKTKFDRKYFLMDFFGRMPKTMLDQADVEVESFKDNSFLVWAGGRQVYNSNCDDCGDVEAVREVLRCVSCEIDAPAPKV